MAEVLTISALERRTGVPRSKIHFYIREGLLPAPQKTAASRALYTDHHARLLEEIGRLKQRGLSLAQIRAQLASQLAEAKMDESDLAAQESERIRKAILRVATEEFVTKGYEKTRVADIIRRLGITPQVFYSHFPSKRRLLAESFRTFISWNLAYVEPKLAQTADVGERLLWRVLADFRANGFGSEVLALVRSGDGDDRELVRLVERAWEQVITIIVDDLVQSRSPDLPPPRVSLELLAYSLIGALHNSSLRVSWDETYTRVDLVRTHLWLYLAVMAAMSGEVDIDSRIARYEELIREVAAREPLTPPAVEG